MSGHRSATAVNIDAGLQPVALVLNLLARFVLAAAHEHGGGQLRGGPFPEERLFVTELEPDLSLHRPAAGLLGQEYQVRSAGELAARHAGLDIGRGGREGFAFADGRAALVVLE